MQIYALCLFSLLGLELFAIVIITKGAFMSRIYAKKKEFQAQIRRQHIQQRISQIRKCIDIELMAPKDLARLMKIPFPEEYDCRMIDILLEIEESLCILPFYGDKEEMIEQRESPKIMPLDLHVRFWRLYSEQLFHKQCEFDSKIGDVIFKIIKKYSYAYIHHSTVYELHFLNMIQLSSPYFPVRAKHDVMNWISGTQGLRVIDAFLEDPQLKFPSCRIFPQLYKVIQIGLKSELRSENEDAAHTLQRILLKADLDDSFDIYSRCYGLMSCVCVKIQKYWKHEPTTKFNKTALYMLDTFDQAVLDYGRGGLAQVAGILITSQFEQNYTDGLQMLRLLTQVDNKEMLIYLLNAREIEKTGMWSRMCREQILVRHQNRKIRQHYQAIIHNILAIGNQQDIEKLAIHFGGRYEDMLQMLMEEMENNHDDQEILCLIIGSFRSLVYYGCEGRREHLLLGVFERRGITRLLEKQTQRQGRVGIQAKMVLDKLYHKTEEEEQLYMI